MEGEGTEGRGGLSGNKEVEGPLNGRVLVEPGGGCWSSLGGDICPLSDSVSTPEIIHFISATSLSTVTRRRFIFEES